MYTKLRITVGLYPTKLSLYNCHILSLSQVITLWQFNIAIEHAINIVEFTIKHCDFP
jgi:hypothetical protein